MNKNDPIDIDELLREYFINQLSYRQLANKYGYSHTYIQFLINENKKKYNKNIICTLKCKNCKKSHDIYYKPRYDVYCSCGKNLIMFCLINHLNAKVTYRHKNFKTDNFWSFDKWE